jgi:anaerobic selenocysteine-containing dehydrogenase
MPAQEKVRDGLRREDLFTVVFDQVMTDTARYADVVLPATTFLEHDEFSRGYGSYAVHRSAQVVPRVGESRPNYEVFAELCQRTGVARPDDPRTPPELTAALLRDRDPEGRFAQAFREGRSVPPDCGAAPVQFVDVFPRTGDRKVHLCPEELDREAPQGLYGWVRDPATAITPLALISPALARQVSSTFGQLDRRSAALSIHPDDAAVRGIQDGAPVRVWNALGEVRCLAAVTDEVRPGVVSLAKGLWSHHTQNGATANALSPDTLSDLGQNACFNDARVQVARV